MVDETNAEQVFQAYVEAYRLIEAQKMRINHLEDLVEELYNELEWANNLVEESN